MNGPFPISGRFEAILAGTHPASDAPVPAERYSLRASVDGYEIRENGDLIATFHGPQLGLASRLLRLLKADEAQQQASRITFRGPCMDWAAVPGEVA